MSSSLQAISDFGNVLRKIKNQFRFNSSDSELRKYWMPDSNSKECYDCGGKFTAIKRKHHCRVCGLTFCNKCCKEDIQGHYIGYPSNYRLRVCTHCYEKVNSINKNGNISSNPRYRFDCNKGHTIHASTSQANSFKPPSIHEIFGSGLESGQLRPSESECPLNEENNGFYSNRRSISAMYKFTRRASMSLYENDYSKSPQHSMQHDSPFKLFRIDNNTNRSSFSTHKTLWNDDEDVCLQQRLESYASQEECSHEPTWVKEIDQTKSNEDVSDISYSHSIEVMEASQDKNSNDSASQKSIMYSENGYEVELDFEHSLVALSKPRDNEKILQTNCELLSKQDTSTNEVDLESDIPFIPSFVDLLNCVSDSPEAEALNRLDKAFNKISNKLLIELLEKNDLPHSWINPITKISQMATQTVVTEENKIDVNQYVKIKCVEGGNITDFILVNGLAFSKNVTHRKMAKKIENPKILLISCPVVYHQRAGQKLTSLESILLQEADYLKNLVNKILSFQPNIVVVEKTVARIAQEMLFEAGMTLVINVKPRTLEKLARFTGGEIVNSLEAQIRCPILGQCKDFHLLKLTESKTLMLFDGCPPSLGCTIVLRGSESFEELKKLKNICHFMIYCHYNWRLERSFLMYSFAMPPECNESKNESEKCEEMNDANIEWTTVEDESDPLRYMAHMDKSSIANMVSPISSRNTNEAFEMKLGERVANFLNNHILICSPFIDIKLPHFFDALNDNCAVKRYLNEKNSFWTEHFHNLDIIRKEKTYFKIKETNITTETRFSPNENLPVENLHPFIMKDLGCDLDSMHTLDLLADFRAFGLTLQIPKATKKRRNSHHSTESSESWNDPFDVQFYQGLPLLYFRFSSLAPFCVEPWTRLMEFYGPNDVSLGTFLKQCCFSPDHSCPGCSYSRLTHFIVFAHESGCIRISVKEIDKEFSSGPSTIVGWSYCQKCHTKSAPVLLSQDAQSISFCKFIELKIYGEKYRRRRCSISSGCNEHSLFHDHTQCFAYKNQIALFKYQPITVYEFALPPTEIFLNCESGFIVSLNEQMNPLTDHYHLPMRDKLPIVVKDSDVGSIIAYSLASTDYERQLSEINRISASPCLKKKLLVSLDSSTSSVPTEPKTSVFDVSSNSLSSKNTPNAPFPHIELQFGDSTTKFYCVVYFAEQFRKFRSEIVNISGTSTESPPSSTPVSSNISNMSVEESFVKSLSHCVKWINQGGKSKSEFYKTMDDRFILKGMTKPEFQTFLSIAKSYFEYVCYAISTNKPTLLAKIFGVYKVSFKNYSTNSASKLFLLVVENIFYQRNISKRFDLKGSVRNRLANSNEHDAVLLDENLIKLIRETPLYVRCHSKKILQTAIDCDSWFLSNFSIMDYSLLVGIDDEKKEFVVGIIDYVRSYTWDKKIENVVKSVGSHGKPTICSPHEYRERFCTRMSQYFLCLPDRWYRLESFDKSFTINDRL